MDLQIRKLNLITYLAQLQDEPFFDKIEECILSRSEKADCSDFVPFTIETLTRRLETSEEDLKTEDTGLRKIWKVNHLTGSI